MVIKRKEHVESYLVQRPNGKTDIVDVYQSIIAAGHIGDPDAELTGMKEAKLRESHSVNFVDDTTFKDIFPEELLTIIGKL